MHPQDVRILVEQAAALMERFERRAQEIEQRQQSLAQQLPGLLRQSVDAVLKEFPAQVRGQVQAALEQTTRDYERRLQEAAAQSHVLARQIERMEHIHRHVVWKTVGVAALALLALGVGGAALSAHYYGKVQDNRIAADLLQRYNAADVAPCGDGLCANVDLKAPRYGDRRQYRPVKPRP